MLAVGLFVFSFQLFAVLSSCLGFFKRNKPPEEEEEEEDDLDDELKTDEEGMELDEFGEELPLGPGEAGSPFDDPMLSDVSPPPRVLSFTLLWCFVVVHG